MRKQDPAKTQCGFLVILWMKIASLTEKNLCKVTHFVNFVLDSHITVYPGKNSEDYNQLKDVKHVLVDEEYDRIYFSAL